MNKKGKFSKSLFGFKRADVIDYIEQTSNEAYATVQDREDTIALLNEHLKTAKDELKSEKRINAELNEQLKAVELEFVQMKELAAVLKAGLEGYEQKSKQIGEVYVEAKVSANKIIRDANNSADQIVSTAQSCANKTLNDIADAQSDIVMAKRGFYDMMDEFEKRLEAISESIIAAKSKISPTNSVFSVKTDITEDDLLNDAVLPNNK